MKKLYTIAIVAVLMLALTACSGGGSSKKTEAWTRSGTFVDENDAMLIVNPSDSDELSGWYVGFFPGGEMYGWYIQQEGDTLHGDLIPDEMGDEDFIVTLSEEGDDGILLEVEGGDTYHFAPVHEEEQASKESAAKFSVRVNTEGMGQIAYAKEGEELAFNDETPAQSAYFSETEATTYQISAKADEGWKFVKWTKDGEDYSTDETITVEVNEADTEYVAVFDAE